MDISGLDRAGFTLFGNMQSEFLTSIAKMFSLDNNIILITGAVILVILCVLPETRRIGLALVSAIAMGYLVADGIIKPLVNRIRPYIAMADDPIF